MAGYVPPPPPEPGSQRWKHDRMFEYLMHYFPKSLPEHNCIVKLPDVAGHTLGYAAIFYHKGSGWDYFQCDSITGSGT